MKRTVYSVSLSPYDPSPTVEVPMSDEPIRPGQVSATPEGGPIDEGVPAHEPGLGQVQSTPEAAPLSESEELRPPTWQEHMRGPILGADGLPSGRSKDRRPRHPRRSRRRRGRKTRKPANRPPPHLKMARSYASGRLTRANRSARCAGTRSATPPRSWPRPRSSPSRRSIFPVAGSRGWLATWRLDVKSEMRRRRESQRAIAERSCARRIAHCTPAA